MTVLIEFFPLTEATEVHLASVVERGCAAAPLC
jgi:hypothetical protein